MSDDFTMVRFTGMESVQINFQRALKFYRAALDDLESVIKNDLAEWEGDARNAYTQAQARWDQAGLRMQAAVQALGQAIGDSNMKYRHTESTNAAMWG